MTKISNSQMRKIYAMAKELDLDNDLLHAFTMNIVGEERISHLSKLQAIKLIGELEYKKTGIRKNVSPKSRATTEQIYKIRALEKELGWNDNPKRLQGFIRKYSKVDNIRWLTEKAASNLIEGLKKILEREQEKKLSETMTK